MTRIDRRTVLGGVVGAAGLTFFQGGRQAQEEASALIGRTPHTRFAINVEMWWRKLPFLDRIREAAALGFPAIEFWPWAGKDLEAIAALCQEKGLQVGQFTAWGFEPGLNDPRNHGAFVTAIEAACAAAAKVGVKTLCVVGGNDQPGMTQPQMHDNIVEGLTKAAPVAEAHDVTLVLEPMNIRVDHKGHCLYGSGPAIDICRRVGSKHVKILWDLYHLHITEGDLCGHLREGIAHIGYVQLADHPGRREPGTGEIHYNRVLKELFDLGYRGFVGTECTPSGTELDAARAVARADVW